METSNYKRVENIPICTDHLKFSSLKIALKEFFFKTRKCVFFIIIIIDATACHRAHASSNSLCQFIRPAAASSTVLDARKDPASLAAESNHLMFGLFSLLLSYSSSVRTFLGILLLSILSTCPAHRSLPNLKNLTTSILPYKITSSYNKLI